MNGRIGQGYRTPSGQGRLYGGNGISPPLEPVSGQVLAPVVAVKPFDASTTSRSMGPASFT